MRGPERQPELPITPGYDDLRVTCTIGPEDWIRFGLAASAPSWRSALVVVGLFVALPTALWSALEPELSSVNAILSLFPAFMIAVIALVSIGLRRRRIRQQLRHAVSVDGAMYPVGPQLLAIGPAGVHHESPVTRTTTSWRFVERVSVDEQLLRFHSGPTSAWMVPRRAFASDAELDRFVEAARRWQSQLPAPETALPADPAPRPDDFLLSFALTLKDYETIVGWATREATKITAKRAVVASMATLAAIVPWVLPDDGSGLRWWSPIFLVGAIAATPSLWASRLVPGSVRRTRRRYPARFPLQTQHLHVGAAGIVQVTENGRFEESWARIHRVVEDADHFYLYNGAATAYVVPKRAFETAEEVDRFHTRARAWQEAAPRLTRREAGPLRDPATAPSDPFAPPR